MLKEIVMNHHDLYATKNPAFLSSFFLEPHLGMFVQLLADQGYTTFTISGYKGSVAHFSTWLQNNELSLAQIDEDIVLRFSQHYCRCPGGRKQHTVSGKYAKRVHRLVHFLGQQGVINLPKANNNGSSTHGIILRFSEQLGLRGLSPSTIVRYERLT
jgi:hypothetical protein